MKLYLYDTDTSNPLAGATNDLDYDYQAEQWVQDSAKDIRSQRPHRWIVKWELVDTQGGSALGGCAPTKTRACRS